MGEAIELTSPKDGFRLGAYRARHDDARRGGLVLIQEIFGVTEHIMELCDGYASDGYEVLGPALYDRESPNFQATYSPDDSWKAM
jgi:carboxymethylenebutenolidase